MQNPNKQNNIITQKKNQNHRLITKNNIRNCET